MLESSAKFTKIRFLLLVAGIILYIVDIGSDIWVAVHFYKDGHYTWFALTLSLVLFSSVVIQTFSYTWFRDDFGTTRTHLIFPHLMQLGMFTRYFQLLKKGVKAIKSNYSPDHREVFAMGTDLSMLRLFESFLESAPQLLLQLYIILNYKQTSITQYICIIGSVLSIAWATVEYRRCFRRSLARVKDMPSGVPTAVYLLYKFFTISSRILSLSLLVVLHIYCTSYLAFVWLCGTIWAHVLQTSFCTSRCMEEVYRGIIGVILIFTFFNIKGKRIKVSMTVYYNLYVLQNITALLLFHFLKSPGAEASCYFWPVTVIIVGSTIAGLLCLLVFYAFLHPKSERPEADEVDGQVQEVRIAQNLEMKQSEQRMKAFLQH